jgi:hypothetical protein
LANFLRLSNGVARSFAESSATPMYEATYVVSGTLTTGTAISLPSSQTYNSTELEVHLNGQFLEPGVDYNYVGTIPRTQISFTFDLLNAERVLFLMTRSF